MTHHRAPFWTPDREATLAITTVVVLLVALGLLYASHTAVWFSAAVFVTLAGVALKGIRHEEHLRAGLAMWKDSWARLHVKEWWHRQDLPSKADLPDLDKPWDLPPPDPTIFHREDPDMTTTKTRAAKPASVTEPTELVETQAMDGPTVLPDYGYPTSQAAIVTEATVVEDLDKLLGHLADRCGTATRYGCDTRERLQQTRRLLGELSAHIRERGWSLPQAIEAVLRGEPLL